MSAVHTVQCAGCLPGRMFPHDCAYCAPGVTHGQRDDVGVLRTWCEFCGRDMYGLPADPLH